MSKQFENDNNVIPILIIKLIFHTAYLIWDKVELY